MCFKIESPSSHTTSADPLVYTILMERDIISYNLSDLTKLLTDLDQPRFRVKQLIRWLYRDGATSYSEMTNLPAGLRSTLADHAPLIAPTVVDRQVSQDGTRKYVLSLGDGTYVETVGIPSRSSKATRNEPRHLTVCFSTQAGCAMQCAFCATGHEGLTRNLSSGEMIQQVLAVQNDFGMRVTNVVSMGQGEPFQNYDATLEALRFLNDKEGFGIGARHITISTCGLFNGIDRLADEPEQFTLAVSLHSAQQKVRDLLMPRCASQPLDQLKSHLKHYVAATGRRVSLEYLLIAGVNDTDEALEALKAFCEGLLCHVNLIPLNQIEGSPWQPSSDSTQRAWLEALKAVGKEATVRDSRGGDIDGACGQLKNKLRKNEVL